MLVNAFTNDNAYKVIVKCYDFFFLISVLNDPDMLLDTLREIRLDIACLWEIKKVWHISNAEQAVIIICQI